jgi:hypothetical protein
MIQEKVLQRDRMPFDRSPWQGLRLSHDSFHIPSRENGNHSALLSDMFGSVHPSNVADTFFEHDADPPITFA